MVRVQWRNPCLHGGAARFRVVCWRAHRAVAVGLAERAGPRLLERACRVLLLLIRQRGGPVFTGSRYLLGEFGWLEAAAMLVVGVGSCGGISAPQPRTVCPRRSQPATSHRDVAVVPQRPQVASPSLLYRRASAHGCRSCSGEKWVPAPILCPGKATDTGRAAGQGPFSASHNGQSKLDRGSMPRRTKARTSEESARCCCLGRKLLVAAGKPRHRKRETAGIKAAEQVDTRRNQEI